ncbi:hypothetical protein [Paenibacillus sp. NAIST15-1]|nr:hypothetical protein [Paenibacillus sp. NAIST15-1]
MSRMQEMMESEHAEHRLQAAEIVLRHAKKRRFRLSSEINCQKRFTLTE